MEINITAQTDSDAERLLELLDKKPAMFVSAGKDFSKIISKWYNLDVDSGHYYYRINRGELKNYNKYPAVKLGAEHEQIVNSSQHIGELLNVYKKVLAMISPQLLQ